MKYSIQKKSKRKFDFKLWKDSLKRRWTSKSRSGRNKSLRGRRKGGRLAVLSRVSILIIIAIVFTYIAYLSFIFVVELRKSTQDDFELTGKMVVGFGGIPEFPSSTFIFKDSIDNDEIKKFLTSGQSVYRLAPKVSFDEVVEFYNEQLPLLGWERVLSVPLESDEQKHGDYWIKGGLGVRIYSRLNDIWYQTVTEKDAREGLSAQVKKEVELQLLLSEDSKQDLRPDFPWVMSFSSEYLTTYSATDIGELQMVSFQKMGSNSKVVIEPLGYIGAFSYDRFLENALKKINRSEDSSWAILNTLVTVVSGQEAISGTIIDGGDEADVVVLGNPRNNVVYLIRSTDKDNPFMSYVIERLEPAGTSLH